MAKEGRKEEKWDDRTLNDRSRVDTVQRPDSSVLLSYLSFESTPVMSPYITCDYCDHTPFRTPQGLQHHLSTAVECKELHSRRKRPKPSRNFDLDDPEAYYDDHMAPQAFDNNLDEANGPDNLPEHNGAHPDPRTRTTEHRLHYADYPRPAGSKLSAAKTEFERRLAKEQADGCGFYGEFDNREEWELAQWLARNLGQNQIDNFLKLDIVRGMINSVRLLLTLAIRL